MASKQDSVPLIRQLLCSTLCSIIKLLCLLRHLGDGGPNQRIEISCLFQHSHVVSKITSLYPLALFYGCTFLWILPWWAARMLFSKRPSIQESQTLTVDATGAHWSWDSGSYILAWKNFIRWHEGKNGFVLYTSPATLNIVPKRLKGRVVICSYKDHVRLLFSRAFLVGLHRQVYSGLGSRHCHGINYTYNREKAHKYRHDFPGARRSISRMISSSQESDPGGFASFASIPRRSNRTDSNRRRVPGMWHVPQRRTAQ